MRLRSTMETMYLPFNLSSTEDRSIIEGEPDTPVCENWQALLLDDCSIALDGIMGSSPFAFVHSGNLFTS
jgi:hypothetical protein